MDADGGDIFFMHNADIFGSATKAATNELVINSGTSAAVEFRSGDTEIKGDIIVAGNDIKSGSLSSATTAITLSSADVTVAGDLTVTGNDLDFGNGATIVNTSTSLLTITEATTALSGDLTVTGDDISMVTNTAGFVMVADGTNFNPVAISGVLDVASNGAVTLDNTFISSHSELAGGSIAAIDEILVNDGGSGHKRYGVDNFIKDTPNFLTEDHIANGDYVVFVDVTNSNTAKKESLADLVAVMAGTVTSTGISDASSVLSLDIQNMTASTTIVDADLVVVDDGANGTLRKMTRANFIESAALDAIDIDGGAIDGVTIGSASAVTALVANGGINIDDGGDGAIDGVIIGAATPAAGTFTAIVGTSLELNGNMDLATATVDVTLNAAVDALNFCLLSTSPSPRDLSTSRMPSYA